jgi:cyclopropane fatty-acyl-phospholipid synthase-like methyltransferase
MKSLQQAGYNERLFKSGLRKYLHLARFRWFGAQLHKRNLTPRAVLELGCFDGKLLGFMPQPQVYKGFDANWEGGLDLARQQWGHVIGAHFIQATTPAQMGLAPDERFDIAVSMETLEHVPLDLVDPYLATIAAHLDGYFFITVPNEKGLMFFAKWLTKFVFRADPEPYTLGEIVNATLGRTHKVARREHKGFNYDELIGQIGKHFEVVQVSGHPFSWLPTSLCFSVGIVARSRRAP